MCYNKQITISSLVWKWKCYGHGFINIAMGASNKNGWGVLGGWMLYASSFKYLLWETVKYFVYYLNKCSSNDCLA